MDIQLDWIIKWTDGCYEFSPEYKRTQRKHFKVKAIMYRGQGPKRPPEKAALIDRTRWQEEVHVQVQ